ncbi:MAG: hypothetical protein PHU81_04500 [Acidobacteriota bacterium]|nr:hypothetical protein [Acidobacteriota bacterium]
MSKSMYCNHCGVYVGHCGHVPGGLTGPSTLSGTCRNGHKFSVTCYGDCLGKEGQKEIKKGAVKCDGSGIIVVQVKYRCGTCEGSGKVLEQTCQTCRGTGQVTVPEQRDCPGCENCRKQ